MPRWVALLRGVNVGGFSLKMAELHAAFVEMGHADAETFIASGNVVFTSSEENEQALRERLEAALSQRFGRDVRVALRTIADIADVAGRCPYEPGSTDEKVFITLWAGNPELAMLQQVIREIPEGEVEESTASGREVFVRMIRAKIPKARFSNNWLERKTKQPATTRDLNTLRRILEKWGG